MRQFRALAPMALTVSNLMLQFMDDGGKAQQDLAALFDTKS